MISYLKGIVKAKSDGSIILEVNDIGYQILVSANALICLPEIGKQALVYTYLQVKEDGLTMFGFYCEEERSLFMNLIGVSGVGGKTALIILSGAPINDLIISIINQDVSLLSRVKGIGKKTAERIILELREKLASCEGMGNQVISSANNVNLDALNESIQALIALSVNKIEAQRLARNFAAYGDTAEDIIKKVLQGMNK